MTLAQYQATPTTVLPQELIYGAVRAADAPLVNHQRVVFTLARAMQDHVQGAGVRLSHRRHPRPTVYRLQPDLFVSVSEPKSFTIGSTVHRSRAEVLSPTRIKLDERIVGLPTMACASLDLSSGSAAGRHLLRRTARQPRDVVRPARRDHSRVLPGFTRPMGSLLADLPSQGRRTGRRDDSAVSIDIDLHRLPRCWCSGSTFSPPTTSPTSFVKTHSRHRRRHDVRDSDRRHRPVGWLVVGCPASSAPTRLCTAGAAAAMGLAVGMAVGLFNGLVVTRVQCRRSS